MWQTDTQACEVIIAMLKPTRLDRLWTSDGPTEEASELVRAGGGPLSHGEQIMLRAAFDFWNGKGGATLDDLVAVLDNRNLQSVLRALLVARPDCLPL